MAETAHQIQGFWPMTKHYRQRLVAVIALSFLSFTSPLLLTRNASAENLSASKANPKEIDSLIEKLNSNDESELNAAINKLRKIGKPAIPALIEALRDKNLLVRRSAAEVLKQIGSPAIPGLTEALNDLDIKVRHRAVNVLQGIIDTTLFGFLPEAKTAVPQLVLLLRDPKPIVRGNAAFALARIGPEAKTAVPLLIPLLEDSDANVRSCAAFALGRIGAESKIVVPDLIRLLENSDVDVRMSALYALESMGVEAKTAVLQIVPLLEDHDAGVRGRAAYALARAGEAKTVVPLLIPLLENSDANVRSSTASALERIALSLQEKPKRLTSPDLNQALSDLDSALKILEKPKANFSETTIANLRAYLNILKAEQNDRLFNIITQNQWVAAAIIYLIFFPSLWLAILRLRPLWLLRINKALKPYEFKLPETLGGAPVRIRDLTFFSFFIYRPRVLDAWVWAHIKTVREQFSKNKTVKSRATYIPVAF
jgi:HEAT repeat protein